MSTDPLIILGEHQRRGTMGKPRGGNRPEATGGHRGRYQQVDMATLTTPKRLLNHHGSLSSADSSTLYNNGSHPTSPLLNQRSPMHQLRPRHTGVNRHGIVVALDDDDDLLQPVYQEPYAHRGAIALNIDSKNKDNNSAASSASDQDNDLKNCASVEPATLQLVRKGKKQRAPFCRGGLFH